MIFFFHLSISFYHNLYSSDQDYCVGYLEEVYWSLDPIEEVEIREKIIEFFNENFEGAKNLDYDLYYDSQSKQFLTNLRLISCNKVCLFYLWILNKIVHDIERNS